MGYISLEGWVLIGLAIFFIIFGIASAIHVMWKYKPEFIQHTEEENSIQAVFLPDGSVEILDDIMEDD